MMTTRVRALAAALTATILLGSCGGEPTGPGLGMGQVALAPVFANANEASIVDVAFVRVRINDALAPEALIDTVVAWPATGDSLIVRIPLPVRVEPYVLRLAMANAQGDTVFRAGPTPVRARFRPEPDDIATPVLTYIGVGSNATGVRFVSPPLAANFGQTVAIVAEAFDGQNNVIAGTPIAFSLVNPADSIRARFPNRGVGSLVAGTTRGNVAIQARLLTGPSVSTTISIQPVANSIVSQSGNAQNGIAGAVLAQPLVARVRAVDGLGVQGVPVTFTVLTGGGTLSVLNDTSDVNGDVSTTLTLGALIGAQTVRAALPSVAGAEVTFTATATGGAPARLVILDEPTNTTAGTALAPAMRVAVQDAGGNTLPAAVNPIGIEILNNPGAGVLQGPATVNAVAGIATFNLARIDQAGAGYTLRFTSAGLSADTSVAFAILPAAASALAFSTQPPLSAVNNTPFTVAVRARDAFGNTVPSFNGTVTVAIGTNPSAGSLAGTTSVAAAAGVATFNNLAINNIGVGYTLSANSGVLTAATSNPFDITVSAGINAWINPSGGNWSTAANWSQGSVPDLSDTVAIELAGTYTVTLDQAVTVGRLRLGGATGSQTLAISTNNLTMAESVFVAPRGVLALSASSLLGAGAMQVAGTFNWSGGNIAGAGGAVNIGTGATLNVTGAAGRGLQERTLRIAGNATWSSSATLNTGLGGLLHITPTGTMSVTGDPSFSYNLGGAISRFHNEGTLTRATSTGVFTIQLPWENDGTTALTSGQITAANGSGAGSSSGALQLGAGTTLRIDGGTYDWDAASTTTGTGAMVFASGSVNISSTFNHPGPVTVSGAALNLLGVFNTITGLTLTSGTLGGAAGAAIALNGTTVWQGGNIATPAAVNVPPGATLNASTAAIRSITNATLSISGTANFTDGFTINTGLGASIRVLAGGAFNLQGDQTISYNLGGAQSRFQNQGTVTRVSGTGVSTFLLPVDNDGVWNVSTGTQRFWQGSDVESWSGSIAVAAGTTLEFSAGVMELGATATITGAGALSVSAATVNAAGPITFPGAVSVSGGALNFNAATALTNVTLSGGSLGGSGAIGVATTFGWTGGAINGTGSLNIPVGSTLTSSGATTRSHTARLVTVGGTAAFTGGHQINNGLGSVLRVLAGGSMLVQGDHSFQNNLGGATPLIENLGTLTRNTATGTVTFNTPFTNSGTLTVSTGLLDLTGAATLGGPIAVANAATMRINGGTFTLLPTLVVSGLGETVLNAGTVTGLAVGDTANFARLRLLGGTLTHGGVVRSSDYVEWAGATSINGPGGLTAVDSMVVSGIATRQLSGGALLETYGVTLWGSTASINTGNGARWRNMPTGDMTWSGDGTFLNNLGGAVPTLENRGILRFTGAGTTTVSAAIVDTVGLIFAVASGTVTSGGGGRLGSGKSFNGFLDVTAGTMTLRTGTNLASGTGGVRISGGTVTPDSGAAVTITRLDMSGGVLTHEGTLTIGSQFNWSGGTIQSNTVGLGGTTTLAAVATMNITGAAARTASGTHLLNLLPGSTVNHNATGIISTGQGFILQNGGTYNLQNVGGWAFSLGGAQPTFRNLSGASVTANGASTGGIAMRLDNPGGALTVASDSLRFLLGSTGALTGTATVNAGALVLGGGPFAMTGALTIAGTSADLVIDNAALTVGALTLTVNGDLLTRNGGSINSATATSLVDVNGNAQFNGGQSILSAGTLRVAGNFTQGPTGVTNAFDASGTHRTIFDGTGAQSITFANPTLSRFNRVEFPAITHTATLQTNATVLDSLIMLGGGGATDLVGAGTTQRLTVNGVLRMQISTSSPRLSVPVVEISAVPSVDAIAAAGRGFLPDTAVYLGAAITAIPTNAGYKYNSIRLTTGGAVVVASDTIQGQLHTTSSNAFLVGSVTHRMGKLRTSGTGTLTLNSFDHNITVVDSVIFGGGSTNGILTAGSMTVGGNFVQAGGNTAAFSATGTFNTILNGTALQTVRFDNPGTTPTTSHFARFTVGNASAAGIRILSPVHAVTQLGSTFGRPAISLVSSTTGDSLSAAGVQADSITFDNVPVRIVAGGTMTTFNVIRFQNMSPTATQFRINRAGPATSFNLNQFTFATTPSGGFYFAFNNTAAGTGLPFAFTNATPLSSGAIAGLYQLSGPTPPAVTWNGQPLP
ncbi:MAG: beta strand repeat-containing protein [Gemmatimonadaceae bacterium]